MKHLCVPPPVLAALLAGGTVFGEEVAPTLSLEQLIDEEIEKEPRNQSPERSGIRGVG